jgi:hypothetical protein
MVKELLDDFTKYEAYHRPYRERFLKYFQYYRCYISKGYFFEVSKLVPYAFSTIMSILPRLVVHKPKLQYIMNRIPDNIVSDKDLADKVRSVAEMTDTDKLAAIEKMREKKSTIMNFISDYQWEAVDGDTRLSESLLNSLIYGTSILYFYWDMEKKSPVFEPLLPFNFYPDPQCSHARDLKRAFRRVYKHKNDVLELFDNGFYEYPDGIYDRDMLKKKLEGLTTQSQTKTDMQDRINLDATNEPDEIEILEYYEKDTMVTCVGREWIVRHTKMQHGMFPFIIGYNYHTPGEFWGIGEVELIEQYIEDATDLRATRKENMIVTMNNQWIVNEQMNVYYEDLISAPNQIIRADDTDAIKPIQKPPLGRESYIEEDIWRRDIMEISGQGEYFRGSRPDGGVETATAISSLADTAQARWNLKLINLTDYTLKPLGKAWVRLNKQNLGIIEVPLDEKDRYGNYMTIKIDKDVLKSIKTDYDIKVIPGNNRTTNKDQVISLMQILMQDPEIRQRVSMERLLPKILEMFDIPVFDVIKTSNEIQEEIRAQQEAQAQAQMLEQEQRRGAGRNARDMIARELMNNPEAMKRAEAQLIDRGL